MYVQLGHHAVQQEKNCIEEITIKKKADTKFLLHVRDYINILNMLSLNSNNNPMKSMP